MLKDNILHTHLFHRVAIAVSLAMLCAPDLVTPVQAQVSSEMQDLALGTPGEGLIFLLPLQCDGLLIRL
jgi:hypothetical protein